MKVHLDHVTIETPAIRTLHFVSSTPVQYVAGQFVELSLPLDGPNQPFTIRQFTLSSSPSETFLDITTRLGDKPTAFKEALCALKPGDVVDMSEPMGDFVLPIDTTRPLLFIAGGIGVTPFRSMLAWLSDTNEQRQIKLMYAVKSESDILFLDIFKRAHQHATIVVEKPSASWGGERGYVTADMILSVAEPQKEALLYLSGPEPMILSLASELVHKGVPSDQIVTDLFTGYQAL